MYSKINPAVKITIQKPGLYYTQFASTQKEPVEDCLSPRYLGNEAQGQTVVIACHAENSACLEIALFKF